MAAKKTKNIKPDSVELIEALNAIEREKQISKDIILEAIENSLLPCWLPAKISSARMRISGWQLTVKPERLRCLLIMKWWRMIW